MLVRKNSFFALVGPHGSGKTEVHTHLKKIFSSNSCVFPCDSNGVGASEASHIRFTTRVTQIAREGCHRDIPPDAELSFFWARLSTFIHCEILDWYQKNKLIIMNGFGGTILAHALSRAKEEEVETLIELHRAHIKACVVARNLEPPIYIHLRVDAPIARRRLQNEGRESDLEEYGVSADRVNEMIDFYGKLPGQTVIPINANQKIENVVEDVCRVIKSYYPHYDNVLAA